MKVSGRVGASVELADDQVVVRRFLNESKVPVGNVQGTEQTFTTFRVVVAGGHKPYSIPIFPWQIGRFRRLAVEIDSARV